jgi:hypothetical protein
MSEKFRSPYFTIWSRSLTYDDDDDDDDDDRAATSTVVTNAFYKEVGLNTRE